MDDRPLAPPEGSRLLAEAWSVAELPRLALRAPRLARAPRGDGGPVLALPGYGAPDASTLPLRQYLRRLGHDARGWGLGTNDGDVERLVRAVIGKVDRVVERTGRAVALVGWSLGGVVARETARERPRKVDRVVTYGTPVIGGPRYTRAAGAYGTNEIEAIAARIDERNAVPIRVPVTAIYSRRDGIVDWRACIDELTPEVEHIEVQSTHIGMGIDPDVWQLVAERLRPRRAS